MVSSSVEALVLTIESIVTALVVYACGFVLVHFQKVDASTVVGLSSVVNNIFLPALLFVRLGGSLSVDVLIHTYPMIFASIIIGTVTFTFSNYVLCRIAQPNESFKPWFNLGMVIPNEFSLPLLFIRAVCADLNVEHPPFDLLEEEETCANDTSAHFLSSEQCAEVGELYNFLYALPITLALFTVGPIYIAKFNPPLPMSEVLQQSHFAASLRSKDFGSQQRSQAHFSNSRTNNPMFSKKSMLVSEKETNAENNVGLSIIEELNVEEDVADDTGNGNDEVARSNPKSIYSCVMKKISPIFHLFQDPPAMGMMLGFILGLLPRIQGLLFGDDAPLKSVGDGIDVLGSGVSSGLNMIMACTLALKLYSLENKWDMFGNEERIGVSRRTLVMYAGSRMILIPFICYGVLSVVMPSTYPDDQLLKFVTELLASMPTTALLVLMAQISGDFKSAEVLAIGSLLQFIIGLVSLTVLVFLALIPLDLE